MYYLHKELTEKIISAFYRVYNKLGYGFLEKVYEKAFIYELNKSSIKCESQFPIKVYYDNEIVGDYYADIVVENKVIIEIKTSEKLCEQHEYQLLNYLKATNIEIGLLFNFGKKPQISRKIFSNDRKKIKKHQCKSVISELSVFYLEYI